MFYKGKVILILKDCKFYSFLMKLLIKLNFKLRLKIEMNLDLCNKLKYCKYSVFLLLLLTISCVNNARDSEVLERIEFRKEALLSLHDDLMAEMPKLRILAKKLEKYVVDSTGEGASSQHAKLAIAQLKRADISMWDWMHDFDITYQNSSDSITLVYYDSKYESMLAVDSLFKSATTNATNIINYARVQ